MKVQRAPIEVFNLAFLDIISCAFGAVVMLILLAKNGVNGEFNDAAELSRLIKALSASQQSVAELKGGLSDQVDKLNQAEAQSASNAKKAEALNADIARAQNNVQQLTDQASGLENVKIEQQRAATQAGLERQRDAEVGGIPVDSEYVIFIIDTSGSMSSVAKSLTSTMSEILKNHPTVKGFQVLSDGGSYLIKNTRGQWLEDTPQKRNLVLNLIKSFRRNSPSSPVQGIQEALSSYSKYQNSLAMYVLGDDFSGSSYDAALNTINSLNKGSARIHAVGFVTGGADEMKRFSTLMREVTRQNNGSFINVY